MGRPYKENIKVQLERDVRILEYFIGGISTEPLLRKRCFTANEITITRQVLERRLNKLAKMRYLLKKQYKTVQQRETFYALSEIGRAEISARLSRDPDSIRYGLPRPHHLWHEIALSEVARKLLIDSQDKYTLSYMFDDKVLRRQHKVKRGVYLPDLQVEVLPKSLDPCNFNLEIDAGLKGRSYWIGKLSSWDCLSLVLVVQPARLPQLKEMLVQRLNSRKIYLATVDSFIVGGLLETDWFGLRDDEPKQFNF